MLLGVQRGSEPEAQPPNHLSRVVDEASKGDWGTGGGREPLARGTPVDEFCLRD